MIQAENTMVCMASHLSVNGHMSSHFDTSHLKLSIHAYLRCSFTPCCQNMEILKINFYDVITSVFIVIHVVQRLSYSVRQL